MRRIEIETQDTKNKTQYKTHAIVTYASLEEIENLLCQAKHWAYICHNRDENRDTHYHIIATFGEAKSYNVVRKMIKSKQNTFTQHVKANIGNVFNYFLHATDTAIAKGKTPYTAEEVVYDDEEHWRKVALTNGEDWNGETKEKKPTNDEFIDDLLSPQLNAVDMARKYGRDFIKNFNSYMHFRQVCFSENPSLAKPKDYIDPMDSIVETIFNDGISVKGTGELIENIEQI